MKALLTDGQMDGLTDGFKRMDKRISGVIGGAMHLGDASSSSSIIIVIDPDNNADGGIRGGGGRDAAEMLDSTDGAADNCR